MKKIILCLGISMGATGVLQAQVSQGGLPVSFRQQTTISIPTVYYTNPDWQSFLRQEQQSEADRPLQVALVTAADFAFPRSGSIETLRDGIRVWRGKISIAGAPAIGLLYDQFNLPKGVRMFLYNANQQQVLGAFDMHNNIPDGVFTSDAVQGETLTLELNIDPGVNLADIQLHINKAMVFHRGIEHLKQYITSGDQPLDQIDDQLNGRSSVCNINAICPQGTDYAANRKATVQIIHSDGSACSATLVNNTGNTTASCKPYILTASHCNQSGSEAVDTPFSQYLVRFNFEYASCAGGATGPTSNTMNGVHKVARASYSASNPANQTKGDFMLYELLQPIPASYGANLSGWNNSANIATTETAPKKFIGFHHPYGDNKKLSVTQEIASQALGAPGSHWALLWDEGYVAPGSSGSGLFNGDGYLVGIASVAGEYQPPASCKVNSYGAQVFAMDAIYYSKFSFDWDYTLDGAATNRKLKPWLDPGNTGAATVATVKSDCSALNTTGVHTLTQDLSGSISVYPKPLHSERLTVQYNLDRISDISIHVYDVSGKLVHQSRIPKAKEGIATVSLGHLSNGMYLMQFRTETGYTTEKIMIQR